MHSSSARTPTVKDMPDDEWRTAPLAQLTKVSHLQKRALAEGAEPVQIDEALDSADPRAGIKRLITAAAAANDARKEANEQAGLASKHAAQAGTVTEPPPKIGAELLQVPPHFNPALIASLPAGSG